MKDKYKNRTTYMKLIFIGLGGAIGAVLRYCISLVPYKGAFPFLTLITNILGAVAIGLIVGLSLKENIGDNTELFLKVGLCGGFTTFSTFSLEAYTLFQKGNYMYAAAYILSSVILCIAGIGIGMYFSNRVL